MKKYSVYHYVSSLCTTIICIGEFVCSMVIMVCVNKGQCVYKEPGQHPLGNKSWNKRGAIAKYYYYLAWALRPFTNQGMQDGKWGWRKPITQTQKTYYQIGVENGQCNVHFNVVPTQTRTPDPFIKSQSPNLCATECISTTTDTNYTFCSSLTNHQYNCVIKVWYN